MKSHEPKPPTKRHTLLPPALESTLSRDIGRAIESGQIELRFQPQFSAKDGKLVGAEALARWQHPVLGEVTLPRSPLRFHGAPLPDDVPSPDLGEHSREVLAEWLNLSQTEIDLLYAEGAVA